MMNMINKYLLLVVIMNYNYKLWLQIKFLTIDVFLKRFITCIFVIYL